jgi:hypothetical protein
MRDGDVADIREMMFRMMILERGNTRGDGIVDIISGR